MVGSVEVFSGDLNLEKVEPLPEDFDPTEVIKDPLPLVVIDCCEVIDNGKSEEKKLEREIVLGRNVHTMCFDVTEPDADDEVTGEREGYMASVLARYRKSLIERTKHHLGYPYNLDFDYGALGQLQHFSINNLGDPFIESNYGVHSRQFEVGVLDWFARLWELEKNEYWGYITNCGTEGNLHGILVGREVFPDGILYASRESHYSVFKAARMYRMECEKVDTLVSGEIDCKDFKTKLLCHKSKPAIINVNIGTTVKGAVDDLDLVIRTLEETGFTHDRFYIHCDGALFGLMMPFVKRAPKVSFKKPIGSVSVSGHKFVGCPMPCGVQITRLEHINALSRNVEYLASRDATIMGSRNGHAPIFLWYTLNRKGYRGFQKEVQKCLRNAHYLKDRLIAAGIGAMLNELSSTVVFERPQDEEFVRKWQLACQGNIAHVVVMPNITVNKLDDFLTELIEKRATWYQDGKLQSPCVASDIEHTIKALSISPLDLESHDSFETIRGLLEENKITPADVAENLMPKSSEEDADTCLKNLMEAIERLKEEARLKAEEEEKAKAEEEEERLKAEKEKEKEKEQKSAEEEKEKKTSVAEVKENGVIT